MIDQKTKAKTETKTIETYDREALKISADWFSQSPPVETYNLIKKYFYQEGLTADIGCGNGREANWLAENGYKVEGFDGSQGLLALSKSLFPKIQFSTAYLPELSEVTKQYDNVLCQTVIMHLEKTQIIESLKSLQRILKPAGVLCLSWRVTEGEDVRLPDGRLYTAFDSDFILAHFQRGKILHFEDKISSSSGKRVCQLIWRNE